MAHGSKGAHRFGSQSHQSRGFRLALYCPPFYRYNTLDPSPLHKSALDTMAAIMESVKSCVGGATKATIDVTKTTASTTTGAVKGGLVATADTTKAVANKAKELGQAGLNQTLKTLGAATAFQSIFGENIDKSDAGLTAAFNTVDVDSSGKISVKEMTAYIASVYGGYAARTAPNAVHSPALRPSPRKHRMPHLLYAHTFARCGDTGSWTSPLPTRCSRWPTPTRTARSTSTSSRPSCAPARTPSPRLAPFLSRTPRARTRPGTRSARRARRLDRARVPICLHVVALTEYDECALISR